MAYWVIGGEYTDTSFTLIKGGDAEERIGPFRDYDTAKSVWAKLAWQHVDEANVRYRILNEEANEFWVVGGVYKSTDFSETFDGTPETKIGPFDSYEAAKAAWQQKAWETVDDAHSRWRIEKISR